MTAQDLEKVAKNIRREVIKAIAIAGSGHPAGSLGTADLFAAFYFEILNHNSQNPDWEERDRLFVSNGHVCPAQYAAMALAGYFPPRELKTLRKLESRLQGHPERTKLPGIESTSGPLGSGLGQAAGYALGAKLDGKHFRVYCLTSDGEHDEGNHWESVMFASKHNLSNLTLFVDRNGIQIDGPTEEVMPLNPLKEKYQAFGWNVLEIDGHNFEQIIQAVREARFVYDAPTVIIAKTIPGKGVSFMENNFIWHGKAPTSEEAETALLELK